jgi:hypothetical protein
LKSGKTQPTVAPKRGQTIMVSVLIMTIMTMMITMIMMIMASVLSYGAASKDHHKTSHWSSQYLNHPTHVCSLK